MGKYADITKMTVDERLQQIADMTQMSESDIEILKKKNALSLETADSMVDHVIGTYALPIGVARGFVINGKEYVVPMVLSAVRKKVRCWRQNVAVSKPPIRVR